MGVEIRPSSPNISGVQVWPWVVFSLCVQLKSDLDPAFHIRIVPFTSTFKTSGRFGPKMLHGKCEKKRMLSGDLSQTNLFHRKKSICFEDILKEPAKQKKRRYHEMIWTDIFTYVYIVVVRIRTDSLQSRCCLGKRSLLYPLVLLWLGTWVATTRTVSTMQSQQLAWYTTP